MGANRCGSACIPEVLFLSILYIFVGAFALAVDDVSQFCFLPRTRRLEIFGPLFCREPDLSACLSRGRPFSRCMFRVRVSACFLVLLRVFCVSVLSFAPVLSSCLLGSCVPPSRSRPHINKSQYGGRNPNHESFPQLLEPAVGTSAPPRGCHTRSPPSVPHPVVLTVVAYSEQVPTSTASAALNQAIRLPAPYGSSKPGMRVCKQRYVCVNRGMGVRTHA